MKKFYFEINKDKLTNIDPTILNKSLLILEIIAYSSKSVEEAMTQAFHYAYDRCWFEHLLEDGEAYKIAHVFSIIMWDTAVKNNLMIVENGAWIAAKFREGQIYNGDYQEWEDAETPDLMIEGYVGIDASSARFVKEPQ